MNDNEPKNICSNIEIKALARFVEILTQVQTRVSPPKLTSTLSNYEVGYGSLDKLEFYHELGFDIQFLKAKWDRLGYKYQGVRLQDKKLYLEVTTDYKIIHFYLGHPNNQILRKLFINPSKFSDIFEMIVFLKEALGEAVLESMITRIDFSVDIPVDYAEVLMGLNVKYKKANSEFLGNSIRSGLIVGTKDDKIKIYDKSVQANLSHSLTRIERQVKGNKLVIKKICELEKALDKFLEFQPFDIVITNHIDFIEGEFKTQEQLNRFHDLKALIKYEGYYLAKKKLSINGNFQRDYGNFFNLTQYKKQPKEFFRDGIYNFYKEKI